MTQKGVIFFYYKKKRIDKCNLVTTLKSFARKEKKMWMGERERENWDGWVGGCCCCFGNHRYHEIN